MTPAGQELLARCEGVRHWAGCAWGQRLFGQRTDRGPVLAATQSSEYTDYATGDDFRAVDWQRAARLDELVSRQYRGLETGTVEIVLDTSRGMRIGTPSKFALAQQVAVALGYFALAAGRQVRVVGGRANLSAPSHSGRGAAPSMLDALQTLEAVADFGILSKTLAQVAGRLRRGDLAIVLSDLLQADGLAPWVTQFARPAQQLLFVQVLAPEDLEPVWLEGVALSDAQRGGVLNLDLAAADLTRYRAAAAEFCRQTRLYCQSRGIPLVQVRSDVSFDAALEYLIHILAAQSCAGD